MDVYPESVLDLDPIVRSSKIEILVNTLGGFQSKLVFPTEITEKVALYNDFATLART